MKYSFHKEAEKELNNGIDYYNECQERLGSEFVKEVYPQSRISYYILMHGLRFHLIQEDALPIGFHMELFIKSQMMRYL